MPTVRLLALLLLAAPLVGCQTNQERMAEFKARNDALDDQTCRGYGAKPGTDIYIQCRMQRQQSRDAADNAAMISQPQPVIVNNTTTSAPSTPMLQPIAPPTRCQSMNVGMGRVHTYCN